VQQNRRSSRERNDRPQSLYERKDMYRILHTVEILASGKCYGGSMSRSWLSEMQKVMFQYQAEECNAFTHLISRAPEPPNPSEMILINLLGSVFFSLRGNTFLDNLKLKSILHCVSQLGSPKCLSFPLIERFVTCLLQFIKSIANLAFHLSWRRNRKINLSYSEIPLQ